MKCIKQYFRKLALIRQNSISSDDLSNDIYLIGYMKAQQWDKEFQDDMRSTIIFNRAWKLRFVRWLKTL